MERFVPDLFGWRKRPVAGARWGVRVRGASVEGTGVMIIGKGARSGALAAVCSLLILSSTAPAATTRPLKPTGPWQIETNHLVCSATRAYGNASFGIIGGWGSRVGGFRLLSSSGYSGPSHRDDVEIIIDNGSPISAEARDTIRPDQSRLTEISWNKATVLNLSGASAVTLRFGTATGTTYLLENIGPGIAMLESCQRTTLKKWGIDPVEGDMLVSGSGAIGNPAEWITNDDYPAQSIVNKEEGTVYIVWRIGIDGLASDCRVVESSGHPLLDQAACDAITRRARYVPALDKDRKTMAIHSARNVIWRLPE